MTCLKPLALLSERRRGSPAAAAASSAARSRPARSATATRKSPQGRLAGGASSSLLAGPTVTECLRAGIIADCESMAAALVHTLPTESGSEAGADEQRVDSARALVHTLRRCQSEAWRARTHSAHKLANSALSAEKAAEEFPTHGNIIAHAFNAPFPPCPTDLEHREKRDTVLVSGRANRLSPTLTSHRQTDNLVERHTASS